MGSAVPMPDSDAQGALSTARSAAIQSLHGNLPDSGLGAQTPAPQAPTQSEGAPPPSEDDLAAEAQQNAPPPEAQALPTLTYPTAPSPDAQEPPPPTSFMTGTEDDLKTFLPHAALEAAKAATMVVGGGTSALADKTVNAFTGWDQHAAEDLTFGFLNKYIQPALDKFTPDQSKQGTGGKLLGDALDAAPALFMGPAGIGLLATEAGSDAAKDQIDQGHSVTSAAAMGTVEAATTAVQALLPFSKLPFIKKVVANIAGGDLVQIASNLLQKTILQKQGYDQQAAQINWNTGLGQATVMNALYATAGHLTEIAKNRAAQRAGKTPPAPANEEPPDLGLKPGTEGQEPPPPASVVAKEQSNQVNPSPQEAAQTPAPKGSEHNVNANPASAAADAAAMQPAEQPVAETPPAAAAPAPQAAAPTPSPEAGTTLAEATPASPAENVTPPATPAAPETPPAAEAKATPQEPTKTTDLRTVKINGEDVPVKIAGPTVNGKVPVRLIDEEGRVSKDIRQVPEHMVSGAKEAAPPAASPAEPEKPALSAAASEAPEPAPNETVAETPATQGEQPPDLQQALDDFKSAETPPADKKFPGSVAERAQRVSAFAKAIKEAVGDGKDLPENVVDDATKTANRVVRLGDKSPEALAKGQGVSHIQLDAHSKELQRVAENILHPEKATVPEQVQEPAKLAKAKAAIARNRAAPVKKAAKAEALKARAAEKAAERLKEKVIPDVPAENKPRQLTGGDQVRIRAAVERFNRVKDSEVQEAHDNLKRILHDALGPGGREQADQILEMAQRQRADAREAAKPQKPRKMSDDIEEGVSSNFLHDEHEGEESDEDAELRMHPRTMAGAWGELHKKLGPMYQTLEQHLRSGEAVSTHKLLDHLIARSTGHVQELFQKLREHVPDLPVHMVDAVRSPNGEAKAPSVLGNYNPVRDSIQLRLPEGDARSMTPYALAHELVHANTLRFMRANPTHELTQEMGRLHEIARQRAAVHDQMFPTDESLKQYGLRHPEEFVAEAFSNDEFQRWLHNSEDLRSPSEGLKEGLLTRFTNVVKRMLGLKGDSHLLDNVLHVGSRMMDAQSEMRRVAAETAVERTANLEHPLEHEDEFRAVAGDHATGLTKMFRSAVRSGAIETLRRGANAFKPEGGLRRAALRRGVFGPDDERNPLRVLHEAQEQRNVVINKQLHEANKVVSDWSRLNRADSKKLGQFLRDSTLQGIDPRDIVEKPPLPGAPAKLRPQADIEAMLPKRVTSDPKFAARLDEFRDRWNNLTDQQRKLYGDVIDYNERAARANRKAAVDTALDSFSDKEVPSVTRRLLYSVNDPSDFDALVGHGKLLDVGDRNAKLIETLKDLGSAHELEGPYAHLGRYGEHVVQVNPEGTREFDTQQKAQDYADKIMDLGGRSKAKVTEVGGKWQVEYKADYVSMHETGNQADAEIARLRAAGYDVGSATRKLLSAHTTGMTGGLQNLIGEVGRKLERNGKTDETEAMKQALTQSFVKILAARSSYAGSKLARHGTGGVKPEEMLRSFAAHAQSMAWNTGQLHSVFEIGDALSKLRDAVKDSSVPQRVADQRGDVYDELSKRMQQENAQAGQHNPINATIAKAGFFNYLFSLSHSMVYLTQNFTTAIPVAGARYGYGRSMSSFAAAMHLVASPSFRESMRALGFKQDPEGIIKAVVQTIAKDKRFGKFAQGDNSPLQQLIDRGAIHTSFSNQLAEHAVGNGGALWNRTMDWARIVPAFADMYNRISTGLAALELHKGDVYKAGDFVRETHMDYSNADRPRAFRALNGIPGGNTLSMFKTYTTGMAHLLYSHVYDGVMGEGGSRSQALKTVAGMMLGASLFAGLQRGVGIEPLRAAVYAYNKLAGDNQKYHDFDSMTRQWVHEVVGNGKLADVLDRGLPALAGMDMSSRLGLSDLFLHNPPDMLALDKSDWMKFGGSMLGPGYEEIVNTITGLSHAFETGRVSDFVRALPIKLLQNANDALAAATTGKMSGSGAQLTQPSGYAALIKAIGFKTNEEAKAQEKSETASDYRDFASNRKYDLTRDWVAASPADRHDIWAKILQFNRDNPGHRINYGDLLRQRRTVIRQGQESRGVTRDPTERNLLNY